MTTPAEELRAAVQQLRPSSPAVAAHTVAVRIPVHAADALADLLDLEETYLVGAPDNERLAHVRAALAVARAILGQQPRETGHKAAGGPHRASDGSTDADTPPRASQRRTGDPDGLRAQYAEAIGQDWHLHEQVVDEITTAVLAVRDREMQQLRAEVQRHVTANLEAAERAQRELQYLHGLLAEAVDWIHDGDLRDRMTTALNQPAEQAATRLQHARDAAALHRKQLISTAELYAAIEATPEPAPCPQQCGATHQCPLHTEPSSPAAKAKFTAEAPEQVGALQRQLHRADQARRAREHQLDDIRRALCDAGLIDDEDPYSHADLADVIRQTATKPEPYQQPGQCRYCPNPLCPEDCPECGGPIHDLDTPKEQPGPAATQATEPPTICDTYQPPTTADDSGLCARCGMFDYKHQEPEEQAADRAAVLRELEERYRKYARNAVHPDFRTAYAAVANDLQRIAAEAEPKEQPAEPTVAWTPPPPGSTREQLPDHIPDHILALIRPYLRGYTSTACQTAGYLAEAIADRPEHRAELIEWRMRMRKRCRRNQKYTGEICPHHTKETTP